MASLPSAERSWRSDEVVDTADALEVLRDGELTVTGRLVDASNATLWCEAALARAGGRSHSLHAVYKPTRGERPLDDFPDGTLAMREVAAWHVSQATGWGLVPPTVLRDGPLGPGMVQLWIDVDETVDVLRLILTRDARLRRFAVFDALVNNADRKGGHILPTEDGDFHGCDHGICFSTDPKLRTVLWGWKGEPLTAEERDAVASVRDAVDGWLGAELRRLLARDEVDALCDRAERLLRDGRLPHPDPYRHVIPWPPF
jgi:hypothetical protein